MLPRTAEHRPENGANAPHHQGRRLQMPGERAQQDGLAHRHDRRAEGALSDAREDQRLEAVGEAAEERGDREASTVANIMVRQPSRLTSQPVIGVATAVATRLA